MSNQIYSNQHNPQHALFQNSNIGANQNQTRNVQYRKDQDFREQLNMMRQHPKRNALQIQPQNALTYQDLRTGCTTFLRNNQADLFPSQRV